METAIAFSTVHYTDPAKGTVYREIKSENLSHLEDLKKSYHQKGWKTFPIFPVGTSHALTVIVPEVK